MDQSRWLLPILVIFVLAGCASPVSGPSSTAAPDPSSEVGSSKDLTGFSITNPSATGIITGTEIFVTVPYNTNVTALVATFTTTGTSVAAGSVTQVSGATANDFTGPTVYRVTAGDGTTKDYNVTVTVATSSDKDLTLFSFPAYEATGSIVGNSVSVTVPFYANPASLVAQFSTNGKSVMVGSVVQVTGTTVNNFTSPKTYRVTAADGTTKDYTVTVNLGVPVASLFAGVRNKPGSADGPPGGSEFGSPMNVAADTAGNVYVVDAGTKTIRLVSPKGEVKTFYSLREPDYYGLCVDSKGNVFSSSATAKMTYQISPKGSETLFSKSRGSSSLAVDVKDNVYGIEPAGVFKITTSGADSFLVSVPNAQTNGGLACDRKGNIYVSVFNDKSGFRIYRTDINGLTPVLLAGSSVAGDVDAKGVEASFELPRNLAVDPQGNIIVNDRDSIRKVTPQGVVSHLMASHATSASPSQDGPLGKGTCCDGFGLAVAPSGKIYFSEQSQYVIRVLE